MFKEIESMLDDLLAETWDFIQFIKARHCPEKNHITTENSADNKSGSVFGNLIWKHTGK